MKIKIVVLLIFLSPFFIISFFNQPTIDDYWDANIVIAYGKLGAVKQLYETVSGRYFSIFLMSLFNTLPAGEVWFFKVAPIIISLLLIFSFYFFYQSVLRKTCTSKELLFVSLASFTIHLINMRSLYEGLYWTSAAIVYQLAIVIFLAGISSIVRHLKRPSTLTLLMSFFCCLMLPGTSELLSPVFFLVIIILYIINTEKKQRTFLLLCGVGSLIALMFVLFCPGNHARIQDDAGKFHQSFVFALLRSLETVGYYFYIWIINPVNIAASLLLLPFLLKFSYSVFDFFKEIKLLKNPITFALLSICLCMSIYAPLYYFEAGIPFPRVTSMVFIIAAFLVLIFLCLLLEHIVKLKMFILRFTALKNYKVYSSLLFFICIFFSVNFINVSKDLVSTRAYNYNKESFERYAAIRACSADTCYVTPYQHWPSSMASTPVENKSTEAFIHMDKYFGKTLLLNDK